MNKFEQDYFDIVRDILANGNKKQTRNGETISVFSRTIRHKMSDGFPLMTTRKVHFPSIVNELLWFLGGRTDLRWLLEHNVNIWTGDFYKRYLDIASLNSNGAWCKIEEVDGKIVPKLYSREEFVHNIKYDNVFNQVWGDGKKIYGHQWRNWGGDENNKGIDQINELINTLKIDPDNRRLIVSAWRVEDLKDMLLMPCHYLFQVYTRELTLSERGKIFDDMGLKYSGPINQGDWSGEYDLYNIPKRCISIKTNIRSQDLILGHPFNMASYALLLMIIGKEVNMIPDEVIIEMGDVHIYTNQIDGIDEQMSRVPYELPTVKISDRKVNDIADYTLEDFELLNYNFHPKVSYPLSN